MDAPAVVSVPVPAAADVVSRILLADDSPHAQRMGERILREEGYQVVSVTDGETALKRMADVDPDLIVVDVFLPGVDGFELCRRVKSQDPHQHVRVVMTAGMLEVFDEAEARRAGADAIIKKPFEASVVVDIIKPLIADAQQARGQSAMPMAATAAPIVVVVEPELEPEPEYVPEPELEPLDEYEPEPVAVPEPVPVAVVPVAAMVPAVQPEIDPELVRAAVTIALDEAMPALIDDITERVMSALRKNQ